MDTELFHSRRIWQWFYWQHQKEETHPRTNVWSVPCTLSHRAGCHWRILKPRMSHSARGYISLQPRKDWHRITNPTSDSQVTIPVKLSWLWIAIWLPINTSPTSAWKIKYPLGEQEETRDNRTPVAATLELFSVAAALVTSSIRAAAAGDGLLNGARACVIKCVRELDLRRTSAIPRSNSSFLRPAGGVKSSLRF